VTGAVTFAFGAGLVATVNPCGFVMLPAFLSLQVASDGTESRSLASRWAHGLGVGVVLSSAFSAVLVSAGVILALGLRSLIDVIPWLVVLVGATLAITGIAVLRGHHAGVRISGAFSAVERARSPRAKVAAFGAGYALASLSCTLAVVLSVAAQATAGNALRFAAVFAAFAAGASSALLALAISVAVANGIVARLMKRLGPAMQTISGAMLVISGVYLIVFWAPKVLGTGEGQKAPLSTQLDRASSTVANFAADHVTHFAILLTAIAAAALVARFPSTTPEADRELDDGPVASPPEPGAPSGAPTAEALRSS
jgi:cytochrome c-type biogenesis protein